MTSEHVVTDRSRHLPGKRRSGLEARDRGGYGDDGYGDNDYGARKRPRGVPVMRTRAIGSFGGARLVAEEQFLLAKALRSWGVVNIDSEAAFGRP